MLKKLWLVAVLAVFVIGAGGFAVHMYTKRQGSIQDEKDADRKPDRIQTVAAPHGSYDAVVVGTDPEGVAAAVSASRNGLKTLLVDGRGREMLGGLITLGWLNTLDMNWDKLHVPLPGMAPDYLNKGIFGEWYKQVEGTSFDVTTAANAFNALAGKEPNLDIYLGSENIDPVMSNGLGGSPVIQGVTVTSPGGEKFNISAKAVIDATQDADLAAKAGVSFTIGREDLGEADTKMSATLVYRLDHVDNQVWKQLRSRLAEEAKKGKSSGSDDRSAWGFYDMYNYRSSNPERVLTRGLNVGRQNDQTILINAMQIFGIDGLSPASRQEAFELGQKELPQMVSFIRQTYPELANSELAGTAPELYIRETRHMVGLYRLTIVDLLENKDQWDRIALGSYTVDLQRTSQKDSGAEIMKPLQYAIPFRSIVPQKVDGLLVVGRSASYDSLAHGSARVIPNGMAEGQAAGAAAKLAIDNGITFRQLSDNHGLISALLTTLNRQGMELKPFTVKPGADEKTRYMLHKDYPGLKAAVYLNIASDTNGRNDFALDDPSNPKRLIQHFTGRIQKMFASAFPGDPNLQLDRDADPSRLSIRQACAIIARALGSGFNEDQAEAELEAKGLLDRKTLASISDPSHLTNGDVYMLLRDVLAGSVGLKL